ncbi:MAG: acyltransferase [Deltaproteobacteria bacterium]|nr:acyltransferase [Deltaproteobacteria bacterium]
MLYSRNRTGPDIPINNFFLYFKFLRKRLIYNKLGAVGKNVDIRPFATLVQMNNIFLGDNIILRPGTEIHAAKDSKVIIEDDVLIASHVLITTNTHHYLDYDKPINAQIETSKNVRIRRGAWITAHCVILQGVTIGEHSVVAANSVVTDDVEPYTISGGVPARFIKEILKD